MKIKKTIDTFQIKIGNRVLQQRQEVSADVEHLLRDSKVPKKYHKSLAKKIKKRFGNK